MEIMYTASATSVGGREGHVRSADGIIDMPLHMPKEMGGTGGATNPEELFAAGYSACFNGALNLAARLKRVRIGESSVKVDVSIGKREDEGFMLAVAIEATVPGVSQEVADELVADAHHICPYSHATRGNIDVKVTAKIK